MEPRKSIIILSGDFPYGKGGEIFATELKYLVNNFEKVILISSNTSDEQTEIVPSNVIIFRQGWLRLDVLKYILFISPYEIIRELSNARKQKVKFSLKLFKRIISYPIVGRVYLSLIKKIIKKYKINHSDLVLYSYWCNTSVFALGKYKSLYTEVKALTRMHGADLYAERNIVGYLPYRFFLYKNLDLIVFISEHGKAYFKEKYSISDDRKLVVSKLGIDNNSKICLLRNKDLFKILSCSYVVDVKRVDFIIQALALVKNFSIEWTHIGSGNKFESINELCNKLLGDKKNIKFNLVGHLKNSEVYNLYRNNSYDMFVNVSESEGIPISMMEALSFGVPILATSVGGVPEIINCENGILLSSNPSYNEIKEGIEQMFLLSEHDNKNMRENAYNTWNEFYNAEKNYKNFVDILRK